MTDQTHLTADLLTRSEVAQVLNVTPRTLHRWGLSRRGPPIIKVGRTAFYRREALEAWLLALERADPVATVARSRS